MSMDRLGEVCQAIGQTASRTRKVRLAADYLRELDDADLERAVRFLSGRPLAGRETQLAIGGAKLREAAARVVPWDAETLALCFREVGDSGETIGLLLAGATRGEPLRLDEAELWYQRLDRCRRAQDKVDLLERIFLTHRPQTIIWFIKVITGNLRIGFLEKMLEEAVAAACGVPGESVREANNRAGDLAGVALAARRGTLDKIEASLFHPLEFMLAKPLDAAPPLEAEGWLVEDKYDGIRTQVHTSHDRVALYTRGLDEMTAAFPEIATAFRLLPQSLIVDGEVLAWRDGRPLPFALLQQRLARKKVDPGWLERVPVVFVAYDLLYANGELLLDRPIEERRARLEHVFRQAREPLLVSPQRSLDDVEPAFEQARARGHEGLLLKRRGSLYESGRRTGAWLKVKRALGTLDVVVTAAEQGTGRRATVLSDYTFAVRDGERFLNVGKAYSGLTDAEIRELTRLFRSAALERYGRVTLVKPQVVLEVAFDSVQRSPRHKSGYALRFPRIVRWRRDKQPEQADDLARVVELYEASIAGTGS